MLVLAAGLSGKTQAQTTTTSPEPAASNTPSWLQQQKEISGVGKTHIASALASKATQAGIKTRFVTAADLMLQLALAKSQERLTKYMNLAVLGPRLLVIDELGYLPFGREEANLFFHVIAERYERASTLTTRRQK